jgi:TatA/E family protein of Tat protein translocase
MPNIGPAELILILVIALVFIGPGKLPEVGASIGKSLREFRKASSDVQEATTVDVSVTPTPPPAAPVAPVAPTTAATPSVPDAEAIAAAQATLAAAQAAGVAVPAGSVTSPDVEPPLFTEPSEPGSTAH